MKSTVGGGYSPPCFSKPLPYPNPLPSGQTMSGGLFYPTYCTVYIHPLPTSDNPSGRSFSVGLFAFCLLKEFLRYGTHLASIFGTRHKRESVITIKRGVTLFANNYTFT